MDDVTKKTIEELVLNFISEMNEWEKFCNNLKKKILNYHGMKNRI